MNGQGNEKMKLDIMGLYGACSYALDCVEGTCSCHASPCKTCGIYECLYGGSSWN